MIYPWTNGVILLRGDSPVAFTSPSHIKEVIPQQQDELICFLGVLLYSNLLGRGTYFKGEKQWNGLIMIF